MKIDETPIYLKYNSIQQSVLTTDNLFSVQINYIPPGVENAYNCLYSGNQGTILIDKSDPNYIIFIISQIHFASTCDKYDFNYEIIGYWLAIDDHQSNVICSLNTEQQQGSRYLYFFDLASMEGFPFDPQKDIALSIRYDEISENENKEFIVGIKAFVSLAYNTSKTSNMFGFTSNNYTFTYSFSAFTLQHQTNIGDNDSGLNGVQKAFIAVGVIVGVGIIGGCVWWFIWRRRRREQALMQFSE